MCQPVYYKIIVHIVELKDLFIIIPFCQLIRLAALEADVPDIPGPFLQLRPVRESIRIHKGQAVKLVALILQIRMIYIQKDRVLTGTNDTVLLSHILFKEGLVLF